MIKDLSMLSPMEKAAFACAAFAFHHQNIKVINGNAVIAIASYVQTIKGLSETERLAIIGQAFDIFVETVDFQNKFGNNEVNKSLN